MSSALPLLFLLTQQLGQWRRQGWEWGEGLSYFLWTLELKVNKWNRMEERKWAGVDVCGMGRVRIWGWGLSPKRNESWEDALEEQMAIWSSIPAWDKARMDRAGYSPWGDTILGVAKSWTWPSMYVFALDGDGSNLWSRPSQVRNSLCWLCVCIFQTDYTFFLFTPTIKIYLEH